jgi:drug/metabolite transporter (DMT)-like permease
VPAQRPATGLLLAVSAAFLFSAKAVLVKLAYPYGVGPLTLLALRMGLSAPFFALVAWRTSRQGTPLTRRDWIALSAVGLLGYYGASFFDFLGLQYITAGLERLILFTYPTITLLISVFVLGRAFRMRDLGALALTWLGIALAFWHDIAISADSRAVWIGGGYIFASAVCYAAYLAGCGELVGRLGSQRVSAIATCISAIATLVHFGATEPMAALIQPLPVMALSIAIALFCTVLAVFLNVAAIARLGAARTAVIGSVGPIFTIVLGALLLDETISAPQIGGTVLVLLGVWLASR